MKRVVAFLVIASMFMLLDAGGRGNTLPQCVRNCVCLRPECPPAASPAVTTTAATEANDVVTAAAAVTTTDGN